MVLYVFYFVTAPMVGYVHTIQIYIITFYNETMSSAQKTEPYNTTTVWLNVTLNTNNQTWQCWRCWRATWRKFVGMATIREKTTTISIVYISYSLLASHELLPWAIFGWFYINYVVPWTSSNDMNVMPFAYSTRSICYAKRKQVIIECDACYVLNQHVVLVN